MSGTIQPDATLLGEFPDNGKPGNIVPANYRNIVASKLNVAPKRNLQTGNYTVALTDIGGVIDMSSASTQTLTIPTNATVAIPVGAWFEVCQVGTAVYDISLAVGTSILGSAAALAASTGQGTVIKFEQQAANVWVLAGSVSLTATSPNGATLTSPGTPLIDTTGNQWNLTGTAGSYTVTENGSAAGTTAFAILLLWYGAQMWWEDNQGVFRSWNGSAWVPSGGTADPRLVVGAALRTEALRLSLGANTHVGNAGTPGANTTNIATALNYLNIAYIRDANQTSAFTSFMVSAYQAIQASVPALRITLVWYFDTNVATYMGLVNALEAANPGIVLQAEGPNECDLANTPNGGDTNENCFASTQAGSIASGNSLQQTLYSTMKAAYPTKQVAMWGIGHGFDSATTTAIGNMSAFADYGQMHNYLYGDFADPAYGQVQSPFIANQNTVTPGRALIVGEFAYNSSPDTTFGTSNATALAALGMSQILDHAALGVQRQCWYELIDEGSDTTLQNNYGLFTSATPPVPKTIATVLKNFLAITLDTGATKMNFVPGAFAYTLANTPANTKSLLFQRSDGVFFIAIWPEPEPYWHPATQTASAVSPTTITVNFPSTIATVHVYDPTIGTAAQQTNTGVNSITYAISTHAVIVATG